MQARGLGPEMLVENVCMETIDLLGDWTMQADKVLVF
jgi:hypothetical protein